MTDNFGGFEAPLAPAPLRPGAGDADPVAELEHELRRRRRRFWRRLLLFLLLLPALAVVLAPRIVSLPAVRKPLLQALNRRLAPRVCTADDWRLRWLGPLRVEGLELRDENLALRVERIGISGGLLRLLPLGRVNPGTVTLTRPFCELRLPAAPVVAASPPAAPADVAAAPRPQARRRPGRLPVHDLAGELRIREGEVRLRLPGGGRIGLGTLTATAALPSLREQVTLEADWRWVLADGADAGGVRLAAALRQPPVALASPRQAAGRLEVSFERIALAVLGSFLRPFPGGARLTSGHADGTLAVLLDGGEGSLELEAELGGLEFLLPGEKKSPRPPADARLTARAELAGGRLLIRDAAFGSPWAGVRAVADLDAAALGKAAAGLPPPGSVDAVARIELSPLARDFGSLLGLRPDIAVDSGRLDFRLATRAAAEARRIEAGLHVTNLLLRAAGQPVAPGSSPCVDLRLSRLGDAPWEAERLEARSSFAAFSATGSLERANLRGHADLTALAREAGRFTTRLPPMVGRLDIEGALRREGEEVLAGVRVGAADVAVGGARDGRPWVIEAGTLTAEAALPPAGKRPAGEARRVVCRFDGSAGSVTGGCVRLAWPAAKGASWLLEGGHLRADLDVARTLKALRPLVKLPPTATAAGRLLAGVTCSAAGGRCRLRGNGALRAFALETTAWKIREPEARIEGAADWTAATGTLRLEEVTARAAAGTLNLPAAELSAGRLQGILEGRCDLGVLDGWRKPPREGGARTGVAGTLTLRAEARGGDADGAGLAADVALADLVVRPPKGQPWSEPHAVASLRARLSPDLAALTISRLAVTSRLAEASCEGAVTGLRDDRRAHLKGWWAVDFDGLNTMLRDRGLPWPVVAGKAARPFELSAPLAAGAAAVLSFGKMEGALHLAALEAYGVRAGPADVRLSLADGVLEAGYAPPLAKGSLRVQAALEMSARPWVLRVPAAGLALREAPLDEALLPLLARVNPLLGACLALGGEATIEAGNVRLPLDAGWARETVFDAVVELRQAVVAPRGALAEILRHAGAEGRHLEIESERIEIACREGRLTPSPHRVLLEGRPVLFKGSVGLDGSVAYRVEVPLSADLVGEEAAKHLAGQSVGVVVTGTVKKPAIDSGALAAEVRRIAAEAARRALSEQAAGLLRRLRERVE